MREVRGRLELSFSSKCCLVKATSERLLNLTEVSDRPLTDRGAKNELHFSPVSTSVGREDLAYSQARTSGKGTQAIKPGTGRHEQKIRLRKLDESR